MGTPRCCLEKKLSILKRYIETTSRPTTAFIFDLDGTLVDSSSQIRLCINRALEDFGFKALSQEIIVSKLGLPINAFLIDLYLDTDLEKKVIALFRKYLEGEICKENILYPGVQEFLSLAKLNSKKIGIATSKPTYLSKLVIQNTSIHQYVDEIQGTDDFPAKPNPEVIIRCAKTLGAERAVMFGDRVEDIQAARSAGYLSIGISQTFHTKRELLEQGASLAFSNFVIAKNCYKEIEGLVSSNA